MPSSKIKAQKTRSKARIIVPGIILLFLAIIAGAIWYWNTHKKAIIRNKLEKAVNEKTGGLYTIKYDTLELDEMAGDLSISNMSLSYDSSRYAYLKTIEKAPHILFNIFIPGIHVSGVKTPRALLKNEVVGKKLEIINPVIEVQYTNGIDSSRTPIKEIYEQILSGLDLIKIDTVIITGAQITRNSREKGKSAARLKNITLSLVDVKIDSVSSADSSRLLFAREMNLSCETIAWSSADRLYNYSADGIIINSPTHSISMKDFRVEPSLDEEAFAKKPSAPVDRLDFSFTDIHIQGANMPNLLKEKIMADSMFVHSASFKIYENMGQTSSASGGGTGFSMRTLEEFDVPFQLRKIRIADAFVEYKESNDSNGPAGKVQFYHVNALFSNFTNTKSAIAVNNIMTTDISSKFLNKTKFTVAWKFHLLDSGQRFDLKGSMEPINAVTLNPLTIPMGLVRIKSGKINGLEFDLHQNGLNVDGTVKTLYEDLTVDFLKQNADTKKLKSKTFFNIAANFVIKNANPSKHEDARIARVHYEHNPGTSIFNMSWRTLFKGLRESVGVNK